MPGMLATSPGVHYRLRVTEINDSGDGMREGGFVPVLDDPATLGCLLALVREAWTSPHASVLSPKAHDSKHPGLIGKWVVRSGGVLCFSGATEAEALIVALEDAP